MLRELKNTFRPEFLNRVDDIIVFHKLSAENIRTIAGKMLAELAKRVEKLEMDMTVSEDAVELIAKQGYDDLYGARPLRRAIDSKIEDKLSEEILEGKLQKGDRFTLKTQGEDFVFEKSQA